MSSSAECDQQEPSWALVPISELTLDIFSPSHSAPVYFTCKKSIEVLNRFQALVLEAKAIEAIEYDSTISAYGERLVERCVVETAEMTLQELEYDEEPECCPIILGEFEKGFSQDWIEALKDPGNEAVMAYKCA